MKIEPPKAAIAIVAIIILISGALLLQTETYSGVPFYEPTADDSVVIAKRSLLDSVDDSVVVVGDGSSFHGLVPSVIEEVVGIEVVNFGTLSSVTTVGFSELARTLIETRKVKALIYAVLPQSLEVSEKRAREMGMLGRYLFAYGDNYGLYSLSLADRIDWFVAKHRFNIFPGAFEGSYTAFSIFGGQTVGILSREDCES